MEAEYCVFLCSYPDMGSAEKMATELVEKQLAACVNLIPNVGSVYIWEGEVNKVNEVLMMIKSAKACHVELIAWIEEHHPYDVPEIIELDITGGHKPYLDWMRASIRFPEQDLD